MPLYPAFKMIFFYFAFLMCFFFHLVLFVNNSILCDTNVFSLPYFLRNVLVKCITIWNGINNILHCVCPFNENEIILILKRNKYNNNESFNNAMRPIKMSSVVFCKWANRMLSTCRWCKRVFKFFFLILYFCK